MKYLVSLIILSMVLSYGKAAETLTPSINAIKKVPLFDGQCQTDEWSDAAILNLPAKVSIYLMHSSDFLFLCIKGKPEDFTVMDMYIEHPKTKQLHNLHASAQLSESLLVNNQWSEPQRWNLQGWGGFWVPYAGNESYEGGKKPKFLKGSHREIQVAKSKFAGKAWKMMFRIGGVHQQGKYGAILSWPEEAMETDVSTWKTFTFSD